MTGSLKIASGAVVSAYASGIIEVFTESLYNERIPEQKVLEDLERICSLLFTEELLD